MIGVIAAVVVVAAIFFWLLRRRPTPPSWWPTSIYESRYLPPGTILMVSPDVLAGLFDFGMVRLTEELSHDQMWAQMSVPVVNDPKSIVKITNC